jgi:hypothetical protein
MKCFFVHLIRTSTTNHTHYPIAKSVYVNKYSPHVQTQPMLAGALDDGRKAVKWATDYFLKAHTAPNEFYGQVGQGDVDHAYWGRPEDMTMSRPAFKIDTSRPGKHASRFSSPHLSLSYPQQNQQSFSVLTPSLRTQFTDAVIPLSLFSTSLF